MIEEVISKFGSKLRHIYDATRPFYLISRVLLLNNFQTVQNNQRDPSIKYETNIWTILTRIGGIILITLFLAWDAFQLEIPFNSISTILRFYGYFIFILISAFCDFMNIIFCKKMASIWNSIHEIDLQLREFRIATPYWYSSPKGNRIICNLICVLGKFGWQICWALFTG